LQLPCTWHGPQAPIIGYCSIPPLGNFKHHRIIINPVSFTSSCFLCFKIFGFSRCLTWTCIYYLLLVLAFLYYYGGPLCAFSHCIYPLYFRSAFIACNIMTNKLPTERSEKAQIKYKSQVITLSRWEEMSTLLSSRKKKDGQESKVTIGRQDQESLTRI
jgi:hypothetical protein